uniref:Uncharacterized protein n=1 Tax=Cacopsylla melanoneura TaxID=428564 RepID=A0A8D9E7E8_9HEMI
MKDSIISILNEYSLNPNGTRYVIHDEIDEGLDHFNIKYSLNPNRTRSDEGFEHILIQSNLHSSYSNNSTSRGIVSLNKMHYTVEPLHNICLFLITDLSGLEVRR